MKFQRSIAVAVGLSLALFVAGCGDDSDSKSDDASMKKDDSVMVGGAAMLASKNVVENASKASNLTTLVAAVTAADLVETLSGDGPFTVFAPDNDAFAKVDKTTLDTLLKPENKEQLASILTYHVVPGTLAAEDLKDGDKLTTVNGGELMVGVDGDTVTLTDANGGVSTVTQADVFQSNGVAHIIDTVLMPKA